MSWTTSCSVGAACRRWPPTSCRQSSGTGPRRLGGFRPFGHSPRWTTAKNISSSSGYRCISWFSTCHGATYFVWVFEDLLRPTIKGKLCLAHEGLYVENFAPKPIWLSQMHQVFWAEIQLEPPDQTVPATNWWCDLRWSWEPNPEHRSWD